MLTEAAAGVQRPVTTGRRIAIAGVRGGCGKSTLAALVGSVYAARRTDRVLAIDADPNAGSLAWRLGVTGAPALSQVGPQLLSGRGLDAASVDQIIARTPSGLSVLPGAPDGDAVVPPTGARDVARILSRFFAVTVLDCPAGLNSDATLAVLADSHAIVLVTSASADGIRSLRGPLDRVASASPDTLRHTLVALVSHNPTSEGIDLAKADRALAGYGIPIRHLPYDRHLAAGAAISLDQLAEPTVTAGTVIAADAIARATAL
ncbi:AAA family ATPase [Fodinicola feengrottensis]|uniref:AAA family ATPase n=1 Tax=Fodinicola feengrottensis TaxID=435914 RepID=UPI002441D67B|nr:MinD/ParA family protein [Fodinicola feengrottensis]